MKIIINLNLTSYHNHNAVMKGLKVCLERLFKSCYIGNYSFYADELIDPLRKEVL